MISREKAEKILIEIKKDLELARRDVESRTDKWLERLAFYRGLHYTVQNGHFLIDSEEPTGERREVHNLIPSFVKEAVAARIKHFPNPQVPAVDGNQRSLSRAKATERLLKSFVDDDILAGEEFIHALTSGAILGGAWLKIYWDPFSGKVVPSERGTEEILLGTDEMGNPITELFERELEKDPFGNEIVSKEFEGRIKVEMVDLFDGWRDPLATRPSEMRYWVHRKVASREEMQERYPKDAWGKPITWGQGEIDSIWNRKQTVLSTDSEGSYIASADGNNEIAVVYEYWKAPCVSYPNGIMCFFSNNHILYMGSCPYVPSRIPAIFLPSDNVNPGGFFPDGMVEHLIPTQRTLNRSESKMREILDKMLNPHILLPHASDVELDEFGEIPGRIIQYNAGYPPHVLHAPTIDPAFFNLSNSMLERMRTISTYSDITRGDVPGRVESGRAIAYLQENENNIRTADIKLYKKAMLDAMKHCLWLARQYYPDGRMIRTLGDESYTLYEFKSEEYDWDIDLSPEPFSGAPNSRALRWSETMEAWQAGLYNDEQPGSKEVRRMLDIDNARSNTVDKDHVHRTLARMEINQVLRRSAGDYLGPMNPVREFHDDEVHLEEHNYFRNTQEYLDLLPEARRMLDEHCEQHEEHLSRKMANYAGNQAMLGEEGVGQPAPSGGVPSPADGGHPVGVSSSNEG